MKKTFKIIALVIFSFLTGCSDNKTNNEQINAEVEQPKSSELGIDSMQINSKDELIIVEEHISEDIEAEILDSIIYKILTNAKLENKYQIAYSHDPYKITGMFNNDEIMDTAFLVKDANNTKEGLIIRYGLSDPYDMTILGAGTEVLGQRFDDLIWVGDFRTIPRGSKRASNVDENGEIIAGEIPDSLKIELPNDGVYIHARESCGGGIIYSDNESYKWIQQE